MAKKRIKKGDNVTVITGSSKGQSGQISSIEGDYVVVCGSLVGKPGDIVIGLVDNQNTVKRLMRDKEGRMYLKPENAKYGPIYADDELQIQGVVTGLIRFYKR